MTMLASLCLQQEDALNRIRLETSHTLHLAQQGQGAKDDAAVKAAQTNHVLDKDKRFVYQKWDAQASKLVTDPDKKGLTLEEVMAILTELRKLSNDQTVTKFNASRRLKKEPDNDIHCGSGNALAARQPHSGPPRSDDRQRGMGSGSRAVETTQSQTPRASHCHSEGRPHPTW